MTNVIIQPAMAVLASTNSQKFLQITTHCGPIWPALLWLLLTATSPVISIALCVRAWRRRKQGNATLWTPRIIFGLVLAIMTTSAVETISDLQFALFYIGTTAHGAAQSAMLSVNVAHACSFLIGSIIASALCLVCALCLPHQAQPPPQLDARQPQA